jgi:hypothetical protein
MKKSSNGDYVTQGKLFLDENQNVARIPARAGAAVLSFDQALRVRNQNSDKRLIQEVLEHARRIK